MPTSDYYSHQPDRHDIRTCSRDSIVNSLAIVEFHGRPGKTGQSYGGGAKKGEHFEFPTPDGHSVNGAQKKGDKQKQRYYKSYNIILLSCCVDRERRYARSPRKNPDNGRTVLQFCTDTICFGILSSFATRLKYDGHDVVIICCFLPDDKSK